MTDKRWNIGVTMGIDPGSHKTGWGVIEQVAVGSPDFIGDKVEEMEVCTMHYEHRPIEWGVVKPPRKMPLHNRLKYIYDETRLVVQKHRPDVVAIESSFYYPPSKNGKIKTNPKTACILCQVRGVIIVACQSVLDPLYDGPRVIEEYAPREVKKAVYGSGKCSKTDLAHAVWCHLGNPEDGPKTQDASDALAVALCHALKS